MPKSKRTPWKKHQDKWSSCQKCELCNQRNRVVLARGKVPCDVLFVGEAPGVSEDTLGKPFIGPAGKLLDKVIKQVEWDLNEKPYWKCEKPLWTEAFTNLVACIPLDDSEAKVAEPPRESITACSTRLKEFLKLAKPKLVIFVGKLSAKHGKLLVSEETQTAKVIHPAAILRMDVSQRGLAVQRTTVIIADAIEEMLAEVPF